MAREREITQQPIPSSLQTAMTLEDYYQARRAMELAKESAEAEAKRKMDEFIAWAGLPCSEKTQLAADKRWGAEDLPRFTVSIPGDKCQVTVKIPAHSPEEARGRYQQLCGILSTEHPIEAVAA